MSRCDEIYIVSSLGLETEHDFGKSIDADLSAEATVADILILTVNAGKRAPREEDRARAAE